MPLPLTMKRFTDASRKAWVYCLMALERPLDVPSLAWSVSVRGIHLGELLKLKRRQQWLKAANIRTVIDVGAHTGEFASAARALLPDAQIYSFEPLPDCCESLTKKFNGDRKFAAFCVGLGVQAGETTFWRSNFSESSSVLVMSDLHKNAFPWTAGNHRMKVRIATLDEHQDRMQLVPQVLLKVDVQGYEHKVLEGGSRVLRSVDYVLVETSCADLYEGQASFSDVCSFLVSHGFMYAGSWDQLVSPLDGAVLQEDSLFVRRPSSRNPHERVAR